MAYTGTKAQSGNQLAVYIFGTGSLASGAWTFTTGSGSPAAPASSSVSAGWSLIGEINDFTASGKQMKTDDATNLQSGAEEFIATILTPGKFAGTFNSIPGFTDTGQRAVSAAFNQAPPVLATFLIVRPKGPSQTTVGDCYVFSGLVEELNDLGNVKPDKIIRTPFSIKVSGTIAQTIGS
jgi:hypothetical protein